MGVDDAHVFGNENTEIKLSVVEKYLRAYMTALRSHFKQIWYIDPFAGTGSRTVRHPAKQADLISESEPERIERLRGSARIALDIKPHFDRYIFMDEKKAHCRALESLKADYSERNISVLQGDANNLIQSQIDWDGWSRTRAVMFLDPYGMQVDWPTLKAVADTKAIDVWYRFSLSGLYRQAARNLTNIDPSKRSALNRQLGTTEWENELYRPVDRPTDLLGYTESEDERQRNADVSGLEQYVKRRFETIFPKVLDPLPLPVDQKPQMASLFCMISNPSEKAIELATRFGNQILSSGRSSHVRSR